MVEPSVPGTDALCVCPFVWIYGTIQEELEIRASNIILGFVF